MKLPRNWLTLSIALLATALTLAGCNDSSSSKSSTLNYGGSIPRGDYVTAKVTGDQITIKNVTEDTEATLSIEDLPESEDIGSSIVRITEPDTLNERYLVAMVEGHVLGLNKLTANLEPLPGELPVYAFNKSKLTADGLKGKSYNFMELFTKTGMATYVEIGMVGFDTDEDGRLYGAAYDSELGDIYSITDEDDIPGSGDEFSLALTEEQPDGSLVLWENGTDNWQAATTLTGSTSGPVVMDHGPEAGGGAGFAFPQVTETDPDAFWRVVGGAYFLIVFAESDFGSGVEYYKCVVSQNAAGSWSGNLAIYDLDNQESPFISVDDIIPFDPNLANDIEAHAGFANAESAAVRNTSAGKGIFHENLPDPNYFLTFDPEGNYIMGIKLPTVVDNNTTGFGLGIRDRNWVTPEPVLR